MNDEKNWKNCTKNEIDILIDFEFCSIELFTFELLLFISKNTQNIAYNFWRFSKSKLSFIFLRLLKTFSFDREIFFDNFLICTLVIVIRRFSQFRFLNIIVDIFELFNDDFSIWRFLKINFNMIFTRVFIIMSLSSNRFFICKKNFFVRSTIDKMIFFDFLSCCLN